VDNYNAHYFARLVLASRPSRFGDTPSPDATMTDPFVNRELWWLEESGSLLDDARDPATPPLARLRALAAISANLDEFFTGRIPPLKRLARDRSQVARRVRELVDAQRRCFDDLREPLARAGIVLLQPADLTRRQRYWLEERFLATIFPLLTPLAAGPGHPFPFLGNRALALLVSTRPAVDSALPHSERSIVAIPGQALPRCIPVTDVHRPHPFMLLEEVVRLHLPAICHGYDIVSSHTIRVTRETGGPARPARGRRRGMAVRLQVDDRVPPDVLALLRAELGLSDDDVHAGAGVVALSGLAELHAAVAGLDGRGRRRILGPRRSRESGSWRPSPTRRCRPSPGIGSFSIRGPPGPRHATLPAYARGRTLGRGRAPT
jgi:polyphosphate kinase